MEYLLPNATLETVLIRAHTRSEGFIIVVSIAMTLIAITSISGNFAVVAVSQWDETMKDQPGNILVVNLAIIDMITGFFVMIPTIISIILDKWVLGDIVCNICGYLNFFCTISSKYLLMLISIDRFMAILYPLHYPQKMTLNTHRLMLLAAYLWVGLTLSFFVIVGWIKYEYWEAVCATDFSVNNMRKLVCVCATSVYFLLPGSIIIYCNVNIIRSIGKLKSNKVAPTSDKKTHNADEDLKKTAQSLLVVITIFFITFTPYSAVKQMSAWGGNENIPLWTKTISTLCAFFSSAVNPFIYGILRKDYRNAFKKLPRFMKEKILHCN